MTFNSVEFLIFYPIVALLYFVLPKKLRAPMLLLASYYFYMCYQAELIILIFATTLVSWLSAHAIYRSKSTHLRRFMLALTLTVCLGVLVFYKYFNFFSDTAYGIIKALGGTPSRFELELLLPVGISFYTFQTLSYVIDVYRGDVLPERNFMYYALFVSFFPQLVAGPIERPGNLMPQLKEEHKFNRADFEKGAKHMLVGFFKKVCVADFIAIYVEAVFTSPSGADMLSVTIAAALFSVQIYCDFSGYTDIAIGCARIMGIRLMKNFDRPYSATTIKEFWGRWHISLSGWFRDYLYIPLGGNRVRKWRYYLNLMIVFLVSGLWHGAAWTFVIWGALHGVYQIIGSITLPWRNKFVSKLGKAPDSLSVVCVRRTVTFILVAFAFIFFRAGSVSDAFELIRALGTVNSPVTSFAFMGMDIVGAVTISALIIILVMLDRMLTYDDSEDYSGVLTSRGAYVHFIYLIILGFVLLLSKDIQSTFIYFQF